MRVKVTCRVFPTEDPNTVINFDGTVTLRRWFLWPTFAVEGELRQAVADAVFAEKPGVWTEVAVHLLRVRRLWW
jgi:hypothetical protein